MDKAEDEETYSMLAEVVARAMKLKLIDEKEFFDNQHDTKFIMKLFAKGCKEMEKIQPGPLARLRQSAKKSAAAVEEDNASSPAGAEKTTAASKDEPGTESGTTEFPVPTPITTIASPQPPSQQRTTTRSNGSQPGFNAPRNHSNYAQSGNQIVTPGASSSQTYVTADQPEPSAVHMSSRAESDNGSIILRTNRMESFASTQHSMLNIAKKRREISSKVMKSTRNISYTPKQTVSVVDDEMKDFVKSYGMAISKGLDALPADVAIEFSLKVLKEINEKVLEVKFEQNSKDGNENNHDWCSVSDENEYDDPNNSDSEPAMADGGGPGEMPAEKPNGVTAVQELSREKSNITFLTVKTDGINNPVPTQASITQSINDRRKCILKRKKPSKDQPSMRTEKDRDVVRSVDDEMQNFVKSYGLTISRGLETLPGDVTIGVALNVLKKLNQKVLETKFKRKRSDDNKSVHSWRSVSDENEGPDDSDTEMDDCDQVEELPKDNGDTPNNLFLDIPIKIEPEVM